MKAGPQLVWTVALACALLAGGCTVRTDDTPVAQPLDGRTDGLADSALTDAAGREPADAFLDLMAAEESGDPRAVWDAHGGTTPADYEFWETEWSQFDADYDDAIVLEQHVLEPDLAEVRVTYRLTSDEVDMVVGPPGEWWRIVKVDGVWKVSWLPRQ